MGRLFAEPWVIGTIIAVAVLLFAAPRLPVMARSIGQSMRIFKSEVREIKNEGAAMAASASLVNPEEVRPQATGETTRTESD